MSRINMINYEAYALDYLEGQLPSDLQEEMEAFLDKNPTIRAEWQEVGLYYVTADESIVYTDKNALLQPETPRKRPLFLFGIMGGIGLMILGVILWWALVRTPAHTAPAPAPMIAAPSQVTPPQPNKEIVSKKQTPITHVDIDTHKEKKEPIAHHATMATTSGGNNSNSNNSKPKTRQVMTPEVLVKHTTDAHKDIRMIPSPPPSIVAKADTESERAAEEIKNHLSHKQITETPEIRPLALPKLQLETNYAYEIVVVPTPSHSETEVAEEEPSRLEKWGLSPEGSSHWKLSNIKDAFMPEALAKR